MTDGSQFTVGFGSVGAADAYEDVLVPRLFAPCAIALLIRLGLSPGGTLVDVACGTGIVARLAAPVLGVTGRVYGRDLTAAMIDRARRERLPADSAPIDFAVVPADKLDLTDATIDVVCCQQGLQFFPDSGAAVAEMHRVLRPEGKVGVAVWRSIEECPFWLAVQAATTRHLDSEIASTLSTPFSWPGEESLIDVLRHAGFVDTVVSTHTVVMHFELGVRQALTSLAATPLGPRLAAMDGDRYESFVNDATLGLGLSNTPDEAVDVPARTLIATARRPLAAT